MRRVVRGGEREGRAEGGEKGGERVEGGEVVKGGDGGGGEWRGFTDLR